MNMCKCRESTRILCLLACLFYLHFGLPVRPKVFSQRDALVGFHFPWTVMPTERVRIHYEKHFIPLESDPDIFTELMHDLGISRSLRFIDVWSLESNMLALIPRPILALILVLLSCHSYEEYNDKEQSSETTDWSKVV